MFGPYVTPFPTPTTPITTTFSRLHTPTPVPVCSYYGVYRTFYTVSDVVTLPHIHGLLRYTRSGTEFRVYGYLIPGFTTHVVAITYYV